MSIEAGNSVVFPACAVTRSMTRKAVIDSEGGDLVPNLNLEGSFMTKLDEPGHLASSGEKSSPKTESKDSEHVHSRDSDTDPLSHNKLVEEQENDPELKDLYERAVILHETEEVPVCFYKQNGVLMRKWRPPDAPANDEWQIVHQELRRHVTGILIISGGLHL